MTEETKTQETKELLCPKAGTATSSPTVTTASQTDINIVNTMLWIPVTAKTDEDIKQAIQTTTAQYIMQTKKHSSRNPPNLFFSLQNSFPFNSVLFLPWR
jgi:hypothetical protein